MTKAFRRPALHGTKAQHSTKKLHNLHVVQKCSQNTKCGNAYILVSVSLIHSQ